MVITTYSFVKDKKSTKRPSSGGTTYNIVLKENTSIDNPTFILTYNGVPTFDYCHWIFGYYFVEDIKLQSKDVYEINCKLDVLATYRDDILNSTQFVVRSASDYNVFLTDEEMRPALTQIVEDWTTTTTMFESPGTYILRILGKATIDSIDCIPTYILSQSQLIDLLNHFYDPLDQVISDTNHIVDALRFLICSPFSNIISLNWVPHNITGGAGEVIYCGTVQTGVSAQHLTTAGVQDHGALHKPTPYFGDFRDFDDNYTQFHLLIPCVGEVKVNPADVYAGLGVSIVLEFLTGKVIYYLYNVQTNAPLAKYQTNVGANVQIGGRIGAGENGNLVSTNKAHGLINDVVVGNYDVIGNVGSRADIETNRTFRLTRRIFNTSQYGTSRVGRPLREMRTLSSLSGYCQCKDAKLDTSAYGLIKDEIIDYMNEGFIIE